MGVFDDIFTTPDSGNGTISVTELNEYIKAKIDGDGFLAHVAVKGEISNFTNHYKTGHFYFTIKDEGSLIKAVMFKSAASKINFVPENGMKIVARGRVSAFVRDGQYQLYCESMEPDGIGALYFAFEQLKKKLSAEGLFDETRKKPLPKIPTRIGVITSPTGAAIRDIINILGRRFPYAKVILYPALVQGAVAAPSLIDGMKYFNSQMNVDVIIIGRGGGSIEDLWAFNDEAVAREIYNCRIPIISAVGHEIDYTISDFVADLRAPTPSAAAELVAPDLGILAQGLDNNGNLMYNYTVNGLQIKLQKLKELISRLKLMSPSLSIANNKNELSHLEKRFEAAFATGLEEKQKRLQTSAEVLDALSPLKVLTRGYSITFRGEEVVSSVSDVKVGDQITTKLKDGRVIGTVTDIVKEES